MDVTIVIESYSGTNWQQEGCHFKHAFDKSGGVSFNSSKKNSVHDLIDPDNFLI